VLKPRRSLAPNGAKLRLSDLHNHDSRCRTAGSSLTSYPRTSSNWQVNGIQLFYSIPLLSLYIYLYFSKYISSSIVCYCLCFSSPPLLYIALRNLLHNLSILIAHDQSSSRCKEIQMSEVISAYRLPLAGS